MTKRPRLSAHLRLAEPPPATDDDRGSNAASETPKADASDGKPDTDASVEPPVNAGTTPPPDHFISIVDDAAAEMARLTWLGWNKAFEVQLRLARYWLSLGRPR